MPPTPRHSVGDRREAVCVWLAANGINPKHVPQDADITVDKGPTGRFLRCEVFDLTPEGHRRLDEHGERAATFVVNVPLQTDPPEWWQPHVKPTREQLLAAVERVHALHRRNENTGTCEHCSERDYPSYAVSYPCSTVQALADARPETYG